MVGGMDWAEPLAAVIGGNCKRIRTNAGVTQDELARCARDLGLRWNASKVADFEAGRAAPTFATVLTASLALEHAAQEVAQARGRVSRTRASIAELVVSDGFVELNDELRLSGGELADACRGEAWRFDRAGYHRQIEKSMRAVHQHVIAATTRMTDDELREDDARFATLLMQRRFGLTEFRLAKRLGISHSQLADVSFRLWQRTFSEERDRLAGADANKQKRGQVTRTLQAELEKALTDGDD